MSNPTPLLSELMAGRYAEPRPEDALWDAAVRTSRALRTLTREIHSVYGHIRFDEQQIADPTVTEQRRDRFRRELRGDHEWLEELTAQHLEAARDDAAAWTTYHEATEADR